MLFGVDDRRDMCALAGYGFGGSVNQRMMVIVSRQSEFHVSFCVAKYLSAAVKYDCGLYLGISRGTCDALHGRWDLTSGFRETPCG